MYLAMAVSRWMDPVSRGQPEVVVRNWATPSLKTAERTRVIGEFSRISTPSIRDKKRKLCHSSRVSLEAP